MENAEKRQIIEEFLKFAEEVYDAELCEYSSERVFHLYKTDIKEIIDHFIKGE